jgi:chromosome partition protein MukE
MTTLADAIADTLFPEIDVRLREGSHISREDHHRFEFLSRSFDVLLGFYERYGYDLHRAEAGFFYLRPLSGTRRRTMTVAEMLVGQTLALLFLDPRIFMTDRRVTRTTLRETLDQLVGVEALRTRVLKRNIRNQRAVAMEIRAEIDRALRSLERLGFVQLEGDDRIELRSSLLRFTEVVRSSADTASSLARLVREGELAADPEEDA